MSSALQTDDTGLAPSRAPWKRLAATSVTARDPQPLATEVRRLWLLCRRKRHERELGHPTERLDEQIALATRSVIDAYRAETRRGVIGRAKARVLALSTLLDEALFDQTPDATRVSVLRPLPAAQHMGLSCWELPAGQPACSYRLAEQELVLVLQGRPSLRTPQQLRELQEGELVVFEHGQGGSHQLVNGTREAVRFLAFSASAELEDDEDADAGAEAGDDGERVHSPPLLS